MSVIIVRPRSWIVGFVAGTVVGALLTRRWIGDPWVGFAIWILVSSATATLVGVAMTRWSRPRRRVER
jgi:hypothetical protein